MHHLSVTIVLNLRPSRVYLLNKSIYFVITSLLLSFLRPLSIPWPRSTS